METLYLLVVVFLLGLAVFDLVVGVSNDAVNFLTSAVGSRAGSFTLIMIVASVGILIGACSSGGMMEVAKSGVFLPDKFTFQQVIFIYLCVMLADILLLDFFNSLRLPTSTTISIVFELLGASIAATLYTMYQDHVPLDAFSDYINTAKALQMIAAIFVSVAIAFLVGWLVQFVLRALTTFHYREHADLAGAVFGGLSLVIVANFIVNVGLKTSPARNLPAMLWITDHFLMLACGLAVIVSVSFFLLSRYTGFDPFRFITLLGTFALAMAFASNDLVNFIGVPVASYEAFGLWRESGQAADAYRMDAFLKEGDPASSWLLIVAGVIMVLTLWLSKKARNVIQTTVNLSRQRDGIERFSGNFAARSIVLATSGLAGQVIRRVPPWMVDWIERRYAIKPPLLEEKNEPAAFDFVRASANLIVAAFLISLGTSLKLPLSTTYVSFMVLMGTSLADRAWNRDSAVYRVSGVFTVISGWFGTALAALILSSIFTLTVLNFQFFGVGLVFIFVMGSMLAINRIFDSSPQVEPMVELPEGWFSKPPSELAPFLGHRARQAADKYADSLGQLVEALEKEDRRVAQRLQNEIDQHLTISQSYTARLNEFLRDLHAENTVSGKLLLEFFYLETLLLNQVERMIEIGSTHVLNLHSPLEPEQVERMDGMVDDVQRFCRVLPSTLGRTQPEAELQRLRQELDNSIIQQVEGLIQDKYNYKNSMLYFNLLLRNLESAEILMRMDELAETTTPHNKKQ